MSTDNLIDPFSVVLRPAHNRNEFQDLYFAPGFQGVNPSLRGWRYPLPRGLWVLQAEHNTRFAVTAMLDMDGTTREIGKVERSGSLLKFPVDADVAELWFQINSTSINTNDTTNTRVHGFLVHMPGQPV